MEFRGQVCDDPFVLTRPNTMMVDTLIVGGGPAGLRGRPYLADAGRSVGTVVAEAAPYGVVYSSLAR